MTEELRDIILGPKTKKRFTLATAFTWALVLILLLFILLSSLAYNRLLGFESIMSQVADAKLPKVVLAGRLLGQANKLDGLARMLSRSTSKASRRIAEQAIANQIAEIRALSSEQINDDYLDIQLNVIRVELAEFSSLIDRKTLVEVRLQQQQKTLSKLYDEALTLSLLNNKPDSTNADIRAWQLNFTQLLAHTKQALSQIRLQTVRQTFQTLELNLVQMQEKASSGTGIDYPRSVYFNGQLRALFDSEDGLLSLKIQQLRLAGRVIGRENFIHILINDYASLVEFSANEIEQAVLLQTKQTSLNMKKQTKWLGLIFLLAIIIVAIVVLLIQNRVVRRLVALNSIVQDKQKGEQNTLEIKGNDEISDIAHTFIEFANTIEEQRKALEHLSLSDSLTGIPNRRALDEKLLDEIQLSLRHHWPVSLLLIDVDYFKLYNDHYGHSVGDKCLQDIANTLSLVMNRTSDFVARFGGEEFVCILPDTHEQGAQKIAQKIINALADLNVAHAYSQASTHVTVSIGIATSIADKLRSPDDLIKDADIALYQAKDKGRNTYLSYGKNQA